MSQAEELLNSISETSGYLTAEEHIIVGRDRYITVPTSLKRIAVQHDHNVETVTFDCPRYWDEHDLSEMYIYINYMRTDNVMGRYLAKNVRVDETDSSILHFDWTIGNEISTVKGTLSFLLCAVKTDSEGIQEVHWNSELNKDMYISEGLETKDEITNKYPDIITDLLTRMDSILIGDGTVIDVSLTEAGIAAEAKAVGDRLNVIDDNITNINEELEKTVKEEVDPTVSDWAKEPTKPSYSSSELTDGNLVALKNGQIQNGLNAEMLNGTTLDNIRDIGEIRTFCEEKTLNNYLLCDGSIIKSADYPELHSKLNSTFFNVMEDVGPVPAFYGNSSEPLHKIGDKYIAVGRPGSNYYSVIYSSTDANAWESTGNVTSSIFDYSKQIGNKIYAIGSSSSDRPTIFTVSGPTSYKEFTITNLGTTVYQCFKSIAGKGDNVVVIGAFVKSTSSKQPLCVYTTDGGSTWSTSSSAAIVEGWDQLAYYSSCFYASNTTNAGYIQISYDNGAVFGNHKTNIDGTIENVYSANGKLVVRTTDSKIYAGDTHESLIQICSNDTFTNVKSINNEMYGTIDNVLYKIDVINNIKIYVSDNIVGYHNSVEDFLIENDYLYTAYDHRYVRTYMVGGKLPNKTNSKTEGFHYIRAK